MLLLRRLPQKSLRTGGLCAFLAALWSGAAVFAQPFVPARDAHCVAYSPDGKLIATGISGMSNGEIPLRPHPSPRKCAEILIFDAQSGERIRRIEWFGDLIDLQFSPDGKHIGAARIFRTIDDLDFNGVRIWDAKTGKSVRAFERAHAFDFSPDGKSIVVVSARSCTLFDLESGDRTGGIEPLGGALAVRFSPEGKRAIGIVEEQDGFKLRSCDAATGEDVVDALALDEPFYSFDISPDGKYVASGHDEGNVLL